MNFVCSMLNAEGDAVESRNVDGVSAEVRKISMRSRFLWPTPWLMNSGWYPIPVRCRFSADLTHACWERLGYHLCLTPDNEDWASVSYPWLDHNAPRPTDRSADTAHDPGCIAQRFWGRDSGWRSRLSRALVCLRKRRQSMACGRVSSGSEDSAWRRALRR